MRCKINTTDVSDHLIERLDIWLKATDGIGRFDLKLVSSPPGWGSTLFPDDPVEIKLNNAVVLRGYADKGYPEAVSKRDVHEMTWREVGRDYGQDLMNKLVNKTGNWAYLNQHADDIIQDLLTQTGSEISYTSPSTAPIISYTDSGEEFLIEAIRKIAEQINYDLFVDENKTLQLFPVGTISSGIVLKSVAGAVDNNIVGPIKTTKFDAYELRNRIIVKGRYVEDGWSDGNANDYTCLTGNSVSNELNDASEGSVASIKCEKGTADHPELHLSFPKFNYNHLPFTFPYSEIVVYAKLFSVLDYPPFGVLLTDSNGSKIRYWFNLLNLKRQKEVWSQYTVPIGKDCEIKNFTDGWKEETWQYNDTTSQTLGFNWQISKITFRATNWTSTLLVDSLSIPLPMIAYAADSFSQAEWKTRELSILAKDLRTQAELQELADSELEKRKLPIGSVKVTAIGSAGIIEGANKWIPGYTVTLNSPDNGFNNSALRISEVHHIITEEPDEHGHDWIVEATLLPYDAAVSGSRLSNVESPEIALFRALSDKIRYMEKMLEVGHQWYPPQPGMPASDKINWDDLPAVTVTEEANIYTQQQLLDAIYKWITSLLISNASSGQYNVSVQDGSQFSIGDTVAIRDHNNWESNIVAAVNVNTIVMENMLQHTYNVADVATVDKWKPNNFVESDDFSHGAYVLKDDPSGHYIKDFLVRVTDSGDPLKVIDQGAIFKKDVTAGGFLGTNQGAVFYGHGLIHAADPPKDVLMHSGFDRKYIRKLDGSLANLGLSDLECETINAKPCVAGIGDKGSETTLSDGTKTISFNQSFALAPLVLVQPIDPSGRGIRIDVTSNSAAQFSVKATVLPSNHKHKIGQASATSTNPFELSTENTHTHSIPNHKHMIGSVAANATLQARARSAGNHTHYFTESFTTSSEGSHQHASAGDHYHSVGGTTGLIYSGSPTTDHTHSSGGPGTEETTTNGSHAHPANGSHSHSGSVSGYTQSDGAHTHLLEYSISPYDQIQIRGLSIHDQNGQDYGCGGLICETGLTTTDLYTRTDAGTNTGAGTSHSHTLTYIDGYSIYVRNINLRDINGNAVVAGSTLMETVYSAVNLFTEAPDLSAESLVIDFDWIAIAV